MERPTAGQYRQLMTFTKLPQPLGTTALIVALLSSGLLAGLYYAYAVSVMPALGAFDDRTFIDVMNKINVVIVNPPFLLTFLGSVGFTALAGAFYFKPGARPVLIWIGIGLALNLASLAVTSVVNVPLNDKLATATASSSPADLASLRQQFETSWVRWNMIRALANTAATGVLAWALAVPVRG
ncbi:hypothetical protein A5630_00875 [Mycolicibacterium mucogenicum]|uniref:DUF1772 domain-containing protein n=2 Tax=Mycolicibacterium mucogenicum TaxID=56689 RepID=A0A1A3HB86_MYCMU|nr:hypothetical protein A5630_00875 [Mycolicibacterium mucogenicum]